jgi:hypothetical protein
MALLLVVQLDEEVTLGGHIPGSGNAGSSIRTYRSFINRAFIDVSGRFIQPRLMPPDVVRNRIRSACWHQKDMFMPLLR